ncbi:MAG: GntR family transcriptional regulator [Pseudomonadota bacterium]
MSDTKKTLKAQAYAEIRRDIMTLSLAPGTDLDENSLARSYALSRTPLREILMRLAGEGYVAFRENRGFRVSALSHDTLRGFFLAAPMIYGAILQLAASHASRAQIHELKSAQQAFTTALRSGSPADRTLANTRFHEVTGAMSANPYLQPSFQRLLIDYARIGMTFYRPTDHVMAENLAEARRQHDAIIAAIEARDAAEASALAIAHWNLSRHQIERFVLPQGLDLPLGQAAQQRAS